MRASFSLVFPFRPRRRWEISGPAGRNLFAPGPLREQYFTELADIRSSGRTMTDQDWIAVWARHDQYPA